MCHCVRGRVGAFAVAKTHKVVNRVRVERQRLLLDCRQVNLQFKTPPHVELGSLAAFTELELGVDQCLYTSGADIQDCFYACYMPRRSFFCLASDLTPDEAVDVFGWVNRRFLAHAAGSSLDYRSSYGFQPELLPGSKASQKYLFGAPQYPSGPPRSRWLSCAPRVTDADKLSVPSCDNVHCMATSAEACDRGKEDICERLHAMGFSLHEHEPALLVFQI